MAENKKKRAPKKMEKRIHFSIWYLIFGFLLMYYLESMIFRTQVDKIPYSQFKQLVNEGRIKECLVGPDKVKGMYFKNVVKLDSLRQFHGLTSDSLTVTQEIAFRKFLSSRLDSLKDIEEREKLTETWGLATFESIKVDDSELVKDLEKKGIQFEGKPAESPWLRILLSWILPLLILFGIWGFVFRRMNPTGGMMSLGKSKAKVYVEGETKITFNDVAGIDEAVEEVKEVVEFLKNPKKFQNLGGRIPKGVLLLGPPGTGKTLLAKAVAGEARVPFFSMSGSDFVEMFVGVGAARIRDLFQQAALKAPCIIFIDELDALGKTRSMSPISGGHDEREQTLNQLLTEMDGFDTNAGVIIMAATNRPEILDMALLRPGRFDRQVVVDRPDINGREAILKVHAKNVKLETGLDLRVIAARTPGFVGADLANVINEAALLAARNGKPSIQMSDLEEAIDRVIAGLERKSRVLNKKEKEIVAYHEAGHTVVGAFLPNCDPIRRVSIIPRGVAALGYTLQLPTEDRYLMTRSELVNRLKVLLGGRVAEEITFREISTGAQNDLERATKIARSMVTEYGMSRTLGLVAYDSGRRPMFMGGEFSEGKNYSEKIAAEIDKEVRGIIDGAYRDVKKVLLSKRKIFVKLARQLLEVEMIEGEQLRDLLGKGANVQG